jgi:hypothetical protein
LPAGECAPARRTAPAGYCPLVGQARPLPSTRDAASSTGSNGDYSWLKSRCVYVNQP